MISKFSIIIQPEHLKRCKSWKNKDKMDMKSSEKSKTGTFSLLQVQYFLPYGKGLYKTRRANISTLQSLILGKLDSIFSDFGVI